MDEKKITEKEMSDKGLTQVFTFLSPWKHAIKQPFQKRIM